MQLERKIGHQSVGAFGEKAVEAELLRHGWVPANVNATVKNAADFDIYALKRGRTVHLRVKASGPGQKGFQFGGFSPGERADAARLTKSDFTILVRMAAERTLDQFYVVPSRVVRKEIALRQRDYLAKPKRDGGMRKDDGHWTLYFSARKDGRQEGGYDLEKKWAKYLETWKLLDG